MNIDYICRSDCVAKPGGDSVQVEQYSVVLERLGFSCRAVPLSLDMHLKENSVIHIVNVDRPFDFIHAFRAAGERHIIVSPVHHRLSAIKAMRDAVPKSGAMAVLGWVANSSVRELFSYVVRVVLGPNGSIRERSSACVLALRDCVGVWSKVGRLLDAAAAVALLAEGEGRDLAVDTGWKGENGFLCANGIPVHVPDTTRSCKADWQARSTPIVVVGRIEARKRQLEVARLAAQKGVSVTFVGAANPNGRAYVGEFEQIVARHDCLQWLQGMPSLQVLEVMRKSRVLLNASWVEVQSLVDIEAALEGCYVVANANGNSQEWLGASVSLYDADDLETGLLKAVALSERSYGPGVCQYTWTWDDAVSRLVDAYSP